MDWLRRATVWRAAWAHGTHDFLLTPVPECAETFVRTFRRLVKRDILPGVLHPAVRVPSQTDLERAAERWRQHFEPDVAKFLEGGPVFLSVNRFERKKVMAACCAAALLGGASSNSRVWHMRSCKCS